MTAVTGTQSSGGHARPRTLGDLKRIPDFDARGASRPVKNEIRQNLLRAIKNGDSLFPGVHGYEDTVVPQIINALLSRHNFILLGLRGQAKSRILRGLIGLLDSEIPVMAGCEINDDPFDPICRRCRSLLAEKAGATEIDWIGREHRYAEKLATPDTNWRVEWVRLKRTTAGSSSRPLYTRSASTRERRCGCGTRRDGRNAIRRA